MAITARIPARVEATLNAILEMEDVLVHLGLKEIDAKKFVLLELMEMIVVRPANA